MFEVGALIYISYQHAVVFIAPPTRKGFFTVAAKCYFDLRGMPTAAEEFNLGVKIKEQGGNAYVAKIISTKRPSKDRPFTLLEYLDLSLGSIVSYIKKSRRKLHPSLVHYLFRQMVDMLDWLHQHDLIFADLGPGNLMMGSGMRLKAVDYGGIWDPKRKRPDWQYTFTYAAPELLPETSLGQPTRASDCFILGALLQILVCTLNPFDMESERPAEGIARRKFIELYRPRHGLGRFTLPADAGSVETLAIDTLWDRKNEYGDDCYLLMEGLLHTEPAARSTLATVKASRYYCYGTLSFNLYGVLRG
ncbi:Pkinase-domain-containing protein [Pseudohyphozyma bogoriensis]|nr:Pkinase-domain-containing protein [Pseudohyphozyma bogoriensis]